MRNETLGIGLTSIFTYMLDDHRKRPGMDFDDGINEGLEIARNIFAENAGRFVVKDKEADKEIWRLGCSLVFGRLVDVKKKREDFNDYQEGINEGLEIAKIVFEELSAQNLGLI